MTRVARQLLTRRAALPGKAEMGWTDALIDEITRGIGNASAFEMCLSPLYLIRPNCLVS